MSEQTGRGLRSQMRDYPTTLSTPIDRVAARVVSKGANNALERKPYTGLEWDNPPLAQVITPNLPHIAALIGTRHDRITIVGYLGVKKKAKYGRRLLGRCDCGRYVCRLAKLWATPRDKEYRDMCSGCNSFDEKRRKYDNDYLNLRGRK